MDKDEIIRMAREAGLAEWHESIQQHGFRFADLNNLERFAALVAAHECEKLKNVAIYGMWLKERDLAIEAAVLAEREACAKVCEQDEFQIYETAELCAAAIRARSQ